MHHYIIDLLGAELMLGDALGRAPAEIASQTEASARAGFSAPGFDGAPVLIGTVHFDAHRTGTSAQFGPIPGLGFWRNPSDDDGVTYRDGAAALGPERAAEQQALTRVAANATCPFGAWTTRFGVSFPDAFSFEEAVRRRAAYLLAHASTIALGTWAAFWERLATVAASSHDVFAQALATDAAPFSFALNAAWTLFALERAVREKRPLPAPFATSAGWKLAEKAQIAIEQARASMPRRTTADTFVGNALLRELDADVTSGRYFVGQPKVFATTAPVGFYAMEGDPLPPSAERNILRRRA